MIVSFIDVDVRVRTKHDLRWQRSF